MDTFDTDSILGTHHLSRSTTASVPQPQPYPISDDGNDYCRICRGEATMDQPLFYPCKCSGSIKYVHQDCLIEWLKHSQKKYCELCKTHFRFTKLYDQSMPEALPLPLFFKQGLIHIARAFSQWTRYILVGLIWTICLPWSIRQIWRGLFWLADGSWMSEEHLKHLSVAEYTRDQQVNNSTTEIINSITAEGDRGFLKMGLTLLSSLFHLLLDSDPAVKAVRTAFEWTTADFTFNNSTGEANSTVLVPLLQREPSILSDVETLKSLTPSAFLNSIVMDILEGQLICLLLIAAFILVFLIREWVIGQQPILDMPDPDQPDQRPVQVQIINDQQVPVRRRRRIVRRAPEIRPLRLQRDPVMQPPPVQQPQRALTEDNILIATGVDIDRPIGPPRAASLELPTDFLAGLDSPAVDYDDGSPSEAEVEELEPPPLMRGALGNVVNIQRSIEESPSQSSHGLNTEEAIFGEDFQDGDLTASPLQGFTGVEDITVPPTTLQIGDETFVLDDTTSPEIAAGDVDDQTPEIMFDPNANIDSSEPSAAENGSDDVPNLTPPSTNGDVHLVLEELTGENVEGVQNQGQQIDTEEAIEMPAGFWQRIAWWLWHTEATPRRASEPTDTVHIVQDVQAEAPFVPVQRGAFPNGDPNPEIVVRRPPLNVAALQANPPPGLDLNDVNVVEEGEDFDGILELIGMEGPIGGMIQNVIFSLFLITLTLCACVWCPYIWGKIALMVLANPLVVFFRVPLFLLSTGADMIADVVFFASGLLGFLVAHTLKIAKMVVGLIVTKLNDFDTEFMEEYALGLSHSSGSRLEKSLTNMVVGIRPDLPTFSMQSHHALRVFKRTVSLGHQAFSSCILDNALAKSTDAWTIRGIAAALWSLVRFLLRLPFSGKVFVDQTIAYFGDLSKELKPLSFAESEKIDYSLIHWSSQDKIVAVLLGYLFLGFAGYTYLKTMHFIKGLREDQRVEGYIADTLRQASGVVKVVVIIGVEMIMFPFYCGLLLDIAILPLFDGASIQSRYAFLISAPITSIFVHWFIGTCYMFHFALFVSMCRKLMRKGVLYFIRDPDDPTFHPVRDVLERPVPTQLGKIAFSAMIYGGLVMVCLGGVVWMLSGIAGVLPIRWTVNEPRLAFPMDVLFFNFMLPLLLRKAELSKKISAVYEWWFYRCASGLRLSHFLFGQEVEEEKVAGFSGRWTAFYTRQASSEASSTVPAVLRDGSYVRAPASDSVRIPKGQKVFVEVDENNNRIDGVADSDTGLHGKTDERFTKLYIPPNFRARVATFIVLLWIFTAVAGVSCTILPLLSGRIIIKYMAHPNIEPNDLYALTVGIHYVVGLTFVIDISRCNSGAIGSKLRSWTTNIKESFPQLIKQVQYGLGIFYLIVVFGLVLPLAISLLCELYIHVPMFTYLTLRQSDSTKVEHTAKGPTPPMFILQSWTLGLLYLRLALRVALNYPHPQSQLAIALRAIVRNGVRNPDVRLATRAVVLPVSLVCTLLIFVPLGQARLVMTVMRIADEATRVHIYRFAYPAFMMVLWTVYSLVSLRWQLSQWRIKIRDEIYLTGKRLHNFQEEKPIQGKAKVNISDEAA